MEADSEMLMEIHVTIQEAVDVEGAPGGVMIRISWANENE